MTAPLYAVLTPTGARPQAFGLCAQMMARQDIAAPVMWIVVDDCETATPVKAPSGWRLETLRPSPPWRPGENTQGRNLIAGLNCAEAIAAGADLRLAIVEDDDWYHPAWLRTVFAALDDCEIAGESQARYYNVRRRIAAQLNNAAHASLRSTALRGEGVAALRRALATYSPYYDLRLWADARPRKRLSQSQLTVGMKGLPGRPGIAAGHDVIDGRADRDLSILRQWIGDDAGQYAGFYDEDLMSNAIKMQAKKPFTYRSGRYGTRQLVAGDVFDAEQRHAKVLRVTKRACDAPQEVAATAGKPLPARKGKAPRAAEAESSGAPAEQFEQFHSASADSAK